MEDKKIRKKTLHELLGEKAEEEEGREEEKNLKKRKEAKDELLEEEEVEHQLGEDDSDMDQGEEEE